MQQVLICLKKNGAINLNILDTRQKELVALGKAIPEGDKNAISIHIEKAFDAGASKAEILKVLAVIIGDTRLFRSMVDALKYLSYEESRRAPYISVVNDVGED